VRANAIGTGVIDAGITHTGLASGDVPQNFLDGAVKTTPLGRIGDAQDIAEAVIYFASRRAKFVTGQLLNVDGGWSI
jgi:NAD(P)-dependent dehydrogenase (short-subunit alcohol dehydrogenase family)